VVVRSSQGSCSFATLERWSLVAAVAATCLAEAVPVETVWECRQVREGRGGAGGSTADGTGEGCALL
jgi:hypothetical protein